MEKGLLVLVLMRGSPRTTSIEADSDLCRAISVWVRATVGLEKRLWLRLKRCEPDRKSGVRRRMPAEPAPAESGATAELDLVGRIDGRDGRDLAKLARGGVDRRKSDR